MFSVLLSLYFKENPNHFRMALDSLFNQTLQPNEIVLVEDGPLTPELSGVVKEYAVRYPIMKVVAMPVNQGLGKALNEGLQHCSYDLVARMDTDDVAKSDRFEKQLAVFEEHPEIDVCSAWIDEFVGDVSNVISTRRLPEQHEDIMLYAKSRNPINHPVVMFRKRAVLEAGGYQHFPLFEDYYLWVRMLMHGAKFYNIQESLLYFRTTLDMFRRRGGWKYACDEVRFQKTLLALGMITKVRFFQNIMIRFPARIMPNGVRAFLYKRLLRSKH